MPIPLFLAVILALLASLGVALAAEVDYAPGCTECATRKRRDEEERQRLSDEYARSIGLIRDEDKDDSEI